MTAISSHRAHSLEGVSARTQDRLALLIVGAVCAVLFGLMLANQFRFMGNDFAYRVNFALEIVEGRSLDTLRPHFVYEILMIALVRVFPFISLGLAAWIVLLIAYELTLLILFFALRRAIGGAGWGRAALAGGLALGLMLVAPIYIPGWRTDWYITFFVPNAHQNPTMILLKPLALPLFWFTAGVFSGAQTWSGRAFAVGAALAVLATFTKPNYPMSLLPAVVVMSGLYLLRRRPFDARLAIFAVVIPGLLALASQFLITFTPADADNRVMIAPLLVAFYYEPSFAIQIAKLLLSIAFPLAVFVLFAKDTAREPGWLLAWLTLEMALVQWWTLAESGDRFNHANFLWNPQSAVYILFVVALLFLVGRWRTVTAGRWRLWLCAALFAGHLVSGWAFFTLHLTAQP